MKTAATKRPLDVVDAVFGQLDVASVLVGVEVDAGPSDATSAASRGADDVVAVDAPGDHEGDARLVDHQRVGFIDEREMERTMHEIARASSPAGRAGDRSRPLSL